jgi:hypothetical protein
MDLASAQLHSTTGRQRGQQSLKGRAAIAKCEWEILERQTYSAVLMRKVACDIGRFDGFCFLKTAIGLLDGRKKEIV